MSRIRHDRGISAVNRPEPPSAELSSAAQPSAVPTSAVPTSAVPTSAVPTSAVPPRRAPTRVTRHAAGDVIDRHRHENHQLLYVSSGVLAVRTAAGAWVAASHRAVWVPADAWHEHHFHRTSSFHSVAFPRGRAPLPTDGPAVVGVGPLVRELLVACTDPELTPAEVTRVRAVLRDRLRRLHASPATLPVALPRARDRRLAQACALAAGDLSRPWPLPALAARVHTSERTLARLFHAEFGLTYPGWRANARIHRAMVELAGGASVTGTALACGWSTASAFIDVFRRVTGQTPGAYRDAAATGHHDQGWA
jgi:AraC-like DNA-binding protein/quercetin dioxygenase-like cupin family protein